MHAKHEMKVNFNKFALMEINDSVSGFSVVSLQPNRYWLLCNHLVYQKFHITDDLIMIVGIVQL